MRAVPVGTISGCFSVDCVRNRKTHYAGGKDMAGIEWDDFEKVDVRVGKVIEAQPFPEARKPSIKLVIDFGADVGTRRTSAQLTEHYDPEGLVGRQVVAVVNFPPKRIAGFKSEVLVLGVPDEAGEVVLLSPDMEVPEGGKMF
jgi:tRNA-binding protein